jgi:hypothetical protein
MGWGTFIAGRTLNAWNREKRSQKSIGEELEDHREMRLQRETEIETEVLREIKRLQSEGKDVDINEVREIISNRFKTYYRLGSKLELQIVKELQRKTLVGEEASYEQIKREILDAPSKNYALTSKANNFSKVLSLQEEIYATSTFVAITSRRILQLTLVGKVKREVPLEEIMNFSTTRKKFAKAGPLLVATKNGKSQSFGTLSDGEYQQFQRVLAIIQSGGVPEFIKSKELKKDWFTTLKSRKTR